MTQLSSCLHTAYQGHSREEIKIKVWLSSLFHNKFSKHFCIHSPMINSWLSFDTLTFSSGGHAPVSHYKNNAPYCLASMQIQPCWLMLGVVSARMFMLWQVCSMLNKKKTGIAVKANTASQMKAKMYVTTMNCWNKKVLRSQRFHRFQCDKCGSYQP